MTAPALFFIAFASLAILCSLLVILKENPVSSAFSLVMVFFAFAGMYALLQAHLIAALQVLVYAGAIMVLFVFVIMLLNSDSPTLDLKRASLKFKISAGLLSLLLFGVFAWSFKHSSITGVLGPYTAEAVKSAGGNTLVISELMFSEYLLPFELTSVLLLGAIIGAVAIAKRQVKGGGKR